MNGWSITPFFSLLIMSAPSLHAKAVPISLTQIGKPIVHIRENSIAFAWDIQTRSPWTDYRQLHEYWQMNTPKPCKSTHLLRSLALLSANNHRLGAITALPEL